MKTLFCFGTRPEAIKMAPLIREFSNSGLNFEICVTGQHRKLLDSVLRWFELKADYDLNLMEPNQQLNKLSGKILRNLDDVLVNSSPDLILVQGDTTSAFIASIAAFHREIKIGHVEAGLRTHNLSSPFPEELNRQLISKMANFHFAPTKQAVENLLNENIEKKNIILTGNTVIDALEWSISKINSGYENDFIKFWKNKIMNNKSWILVTMHRRENFGSGLNELLVLLNKIIDQSSCNIIWPIHPNPNIREAVPEEFKNNPNIYIIDPIDYPSMIWLYSNVKLIISDSGGIQEEAPSFGLPVVVTRDTTERPEGLKSGNTILIGQNSRVIDKIISYLKSPKKLSMPNPFGDGMASHRIVSHLKENLLNQE